MTEQRRGSRTMFARLLIKALVNRRAQLTVAAIALVLGASLISTLAGLSLDLSSKVGKELRAYGANIVVAPQSSTTAGGDALGLGGMGEERLLSEEELSALESPAVAAALVAYAPYLYGVVEVGGQQVVLAGTRFDGVRKVSPWWEVTGNWIGDPTDRQSALIGARVARQLGLTTGGHLEISYKGQMTRLQVMGIVESGGSEDDQIFVNLAVAQSVFQRPGAVSLVQISAVTDGQPLGTTAAAVEQAVPGAQVKIVGQIADAEKAVYHKIQLLVGLVAVLVLLAAALSVMSTMTTAVLERTREIGLMKALGADSRRIALLFLSEAAALGVAGGAVGYGLGWALAQTIGQSVFNAGIAFHWLAAPLTLGVALGVALLASLMPVRRALAIDPAVTLRGD